MKKLLTILIPTYKNPHLLETCFVSLVKNTEFPYKIVLLNNDPDEGARESINRLTTTEFKDVEAIHLGGNKGWMGAINAGMSRVDTPLVAMMNDDLVFPQGQPEFWRKMERHFSGKVAAVGPCTNYVTGQQSIFDLNTPPSFEVRFLIGFCVLLRTDRFREVGLLDETLPGGDDFDLSIRLRKAGYTLVAEKAAYVHHVGSVTGNAVYGQHWNSERQIDDTNNALIRKHGLRAWYETVTQTPFTRQTLSPELQNALLEETRWWEGHVPKEGKGVNLGSGDEQWPGVTNLDISRPGETGAGGRKFSGATPGLTGDATSLPLADQSVDFLLAKHLFEHLLDPIAALEEWKRVLKPRGEVIFSCPDHHRVDTMVIDYTHVHAYTTESLARLLETLGWEIEDITTFAVGAFGVKARLRD